jgi:magnesium transporter
LRLRDILLALPATPVHTIMIAEPLSVPAETPLEKLIGLFDNQRFIGVPVVSEAGALVGVVRRAAVFEAAEERASKAFLNFSGIIGGEELRNMPLHSRCARRLAFLAPNIILNLIAVTVISRHVETIEAVIALAVFLPIVSDMSGCSGNQAVAVSIRELTLGLIRPYEFLRVIGKEGSVGIINGLILGTILGLVAALWKGPAMLGVVIGAALALNTVVSVLLGGSVPLLLRLFKVDPALASGPILTTVTDMCGFFLVLTLAAAAMEHLV